MIRTNDFRARRAAGAACVYPVISAACGVVFSFTLHPVVVLSRSGSCLRCPAALAPGCLFAAFKTGRFPGGRKRAKSVAERRHGFGPDIAAARTCICYGTFRSARGGFLSGFFVRVNVRRRRCGLSSLFRGSFRCRLGRGFRGILRRISRLVDGCRLCRIRTGRRFAGRCLCGRFRSVLSVFGSRSCFRCRRFRLTLIRSFRNSFSLSVTLLRRGCRFGSRHRIIVLSQKTPAKRADHYHDCRCERKRS